MVPTLCRCPLRALTFLLKCLLNVLAFLLGCILLILRRLWLCVLWIPRTVKSLLDKFLARVFGVVSSVKDRCRHQEVREFFLVRSVLSILDGVWTCLLWIPRTVKSLVERSKARVANLVSSAKDWYQLNECAVLYRPIEQLNDDSMVRRLTGNFVERFNKKTRFELKPREHFNVYDATSSPLTRLLLVPCVVTDRLDTDVNGLITLHNFPESTGTADLVLVVFYHREPNDCQITSTRASLGSLKHDDKFAGVVDIVFSPHHGIYRCPQNDNAVILLAEICRNLGIRSKHSSKHARRSHSPGKMYNKTIP